MELVNIIYTGTGENQDQLTPQDSNLVTTSLINSYFGLSNDYIELFIYDENNHERNMIDFKDINM